MQSSQAQRFYGLDLLRLVAASLVVVYHFGYFGWAAAAPNDPMLSGLPRFPELAPWASAGWVGVEVFFVISGFVIAYSVRNATAEAFARGRVLRLLPALWVAAPITAVALIVGGEPIASVLGKLARSLVIFPKGPWVDGVYWTLCLEVVFYSGVFALLATKRRSWIEGAAIALGCVSTAANLATLMPGPVGQTFAGLLHSWPVRLTLLTNGCEFALGVLLYQALIRPFSLGRTALIALFIVGALAEIWLTAGGSVAEAATPGLAAQTIWLACMGVFAVSIKPETSRMIATAGLAPSFLWLGALTYPLYLIHEVVGWQVMSVANMQFADRWLALGCATAVVLGLTIAISRAEPIVRRVMGAG